MPSPNLEAMVPLEFRKGKGLSDAEKSMLGAAPNGEWAVGGPNTDDADSANNPAQADNPPKSGGWDSKREIRADLIRWLCLDEKASKMVDPRGVSIYGAKITGKLDFSFATVPFPILLRKCRVAEGGHFSYFKIPMLDLSGCFSGALDLDGADVRGSVFLGESFSAEGPVQLFGARVGGNVECIGGTFKHPDGRALSLEQARVRGSVLLREGFSAEGQVALYLIRVGGDLDCSGGSFKNNGGEALGLAQSQVAGSVDLRDGFSAVGEVNLHLSRIGGDLNCPSGSFKNPSGDALSLTQCQVTGSVDFRNCFSAAGIVRASGVQIGGDVDCRGGEFSSLQLDGAVIKGALFWRQVQGARTAELNLTDAVAGQIIDHPDSWPEKGKGTLYLDGFVYDRFSNGDVVDTPTGAKERLDWLDRQEPFTPQPYRQLAKVLRERGDDGGVKQVLLELEKRARAENRRKLVYAPLRWFRAGEDAVSDATVGYGIYPARALRYLCGLTALGWIVYRRAQRVEAMAPSEKEAYAEFHAGKGQGPARYQPFHPLIYSLENCLPLVKLGQDERWQPDPNPARVEHAASGGKVMRAVNSALDSVVPDWAVTPRALRWCRWIMIGLGWLLATFFVAGLTGIIKVG